MKSKNKDKGRRIQLRAVVAYPAVTVALGVSFALAMTSFGPSPISALADTPTPTSTTTATPTDTTSTTAPVTSAPPVTPVTTAPPAATPKTTSTTIITPSPVAIPSVSAAGTGTPVDHHVLARIESPGVLARYLAVDAPLTDVSQFDSIRMRFKLHNGGTDPITSTPQLEYRLHGAAGFTIVPEALLKGVPFCVEREWVPSGTSAGGTKQSPLGADIAVNTFLTGDEGGGLAMTGHRSMGANPDRALTLPSDSYTEQEFTVLVTMDARYLSTYEFRITNGRTTMAGAQLATIHLGAPPALTLSPGQHKGVAVVAPRPARAGSVAK